MTENNHIESSLAKTSQSEDLTTTKFSLADLPSALQDAAQRLHWSELMPVQVQTIPRMLQGLDVMVQSQTGSGKTGAFLLPILHRIDPELGAPQALILVPTRELAVQVTRDAEELGRESGVRPLSIYGGVGYKAQIQGLEDGAQLVVGTPGRILDHLLKGNLNLDRLKVLVFDEADRMLSMGFYPDMKQLQRYLPRGLQSTMFSATYPGHVKRLAQQFLKDPEFISLSQEQVHASDVLHVVYKVPAMQKSRILVKIIEQENPASAIIFCNTKADVHFVSVVLRRFGYDVGEISADLTQTAREEVLEKLRLNKLKFLVATDVAARGIDIHELSHVFQYQPPQDHEAYVHRTGRTGRAGAAGVAISFVSGMEEIELEQISKKFSINLLERPVPADEDLETLISQRVVFLLEARLRKADSIQRERMQRFMRTIGELAANEDSRALLAMLVDEFYQGTFHAPLEQPSERLIEPARSEKFESRAMPQTEAVRSEGEKRRRKRSRKKPGSGGESGTQEALQEDQDNEPRVKDDVLPVSAVQADNAVLSEPTAAEPGERVSRPKLHSARQQKPVQTQESVRDDREADSAEAVLAESPTEGQPDNVEQKQPAPAKKRRRRRPRKSSKPDAGREVNVGAEAQEGVVPQVVAAAPVPTSATIPRPRAPRERVSPAATTAPGVSRDTKPSEPKPSEPKGRSRSRGKSAGAPVVTEAKQKKKIFLE